MNQGKIIEYIDQGKIICTLCLQDKGNKLHLLTPLNRLVNLPIGRVLLSSKASINSIRPREVLLTHLKKIEETRHRLKKEIQVHELWDLIKDEQECFSYEYLAQICFGETVTDDHISALFRALFDDKLYFKMKDGAFHPNPKERVEKIEKELEEEIRRDQNLNEESAWLKEALQPYTSLPQNKRVIDILVDLALYGKEAPQFKYGKELLQRAGITDFRKSRDILIELGIWEKDEPIDLLRFEIRTLFDKDHIEESRKLVHMEINTKEYEDLIDLECLTIDGPFTKDFDDALSLDVQGDYVQLGIHITDVACLVSPKSIIDKEAFQRGSSLYLPCRQIPMIPTNLSQDKLSLKQGCVRPAISLLVRFDKQGGLFDYRFTPSLITVKKQFTYDEVNNFYIREDPFAHMYELCERMRQKRIEQDALILSLPEPSIEIGDDSRISIEMISQETPSRKIVAECMILYNWLAAKLCKDNHIPILYRGQKKASERISNNETGHVYYVFQQRRKLNPLIIDTTPEPHTGLGLDAYTNASSPIRRYLDLITQQQIRNFLLGKSPFYNNEALEKIRMQVTPVLRDLNTIKRNRIRYWILKFFQQHIGKTLQAIILDIFKTKYRIILKDFLITAEVKRKEGQDFSPGEEVLVGLKESEPWDDLLKLDFIQTPSDSSHLIMPNRIDEYPA